MCNSVLDGGRRCPRDPALHAAQERLRYHRKRGQPMQLAVAQEDIRRIGAVHRALADELRQAVEAHAAQLHGDILARRSKRPAFLASERQLAERVHSRQAEIRAAVLDEPGLNPEALRLQTKDPDRQVSEAAYEAMARTPHLFEAELARTPQERRAAQISLETPMAVLDDWNLAWDRVDVYGAA